MSNNKYTLKRKIQYELDDFISKGFWAQLTLLVGCVACLVFIFAIILMLFAGGKSFEDSLWTSLMHIIDQGTITGDETENGSYLFFMLGITFLGMAFTSAIIGIISSAVQAKMNELNKGHSRIIEKNHALVLGFNENTHTIRSEIEDSNSKKKGNHTLVIVDDLSKEEMEHDSREVNWNSFSRQEDDETTKKKKKKTNTIFRSGDLASENTYIMCAADRASAIIVNGRDDFETIRILLALTAYLKKMNAYISNERMPAIVALIRKRENLSAARIATGLSQNKGPDEKFEKNEHMIRILYFKEILSRLFAQVCIQPGMSMVMSDLINNNDASFYIENKENEENEKLQAAIMGKNIYEITKILRAVTPVGFARADENLQMHMLLNPDPDVRYSKEDMLIYLSDSELDYDFEKVEAAELVGEPSKGQVTQEKLTRNFLIMGWSASLPGFLRSMNGFCDEGSRIDIITPTEAEYDGEELDSFDTQNVIEDDPYNWEYVKKQLEEHPYWLDKDDERHLTNMVILSMGNAEDEEADEKAMVLLLNVRNYIRQHCDFSIFITTEIRQPKNQALVQSMSANDYVVGAHIASRFMVQIAEDTKKLYIFDKIIKQNRRIVEMRPFAEYVDVEKPFNYQGLADQVFRKGAEMGTHEIPIGWVVLNTERRLFEEENDFSRRLKLNPVGEYRSRLFVDVNKNGFKDYKVVVISDRLQDIVVPEGMKA